LAQGGACKPFARLNVAIGDDDPLGSFIFRTTGYNSIRTLSARLQYFQALSGDRLACLPLELRLRGKSTRQSLGTPIYYVDLTVRATVTLEEALADACNLNEQRQAAGFDQAALDAAARAGFANGAFEDAEDEGEALVEEFFPEGEASPVTGSGSSAEGRSEPPARPSLRDKLDRKAQQAESLVLAEPELP
jgi:hypothetical protein